MDNSGDRAVIHVCRRAPRSPWCAVVPHYNNHKRDAMGCGQQLGKRRVEMRRLEMLTEPDYIDWLKSIGCTFYAPLTHNNLYNLIDGAEGYTPDSRYSSLEWDNAENAYKFTLIKAGYPGLQWDSELLPNAAIGQYMRDTQNTVISDVKYISVSSTTKHFGKYSAPIFLGKCTDVGYFNVNNNGTRVFVYLTPYNHDIDPQKRGNSTTYPTTGIWSCWASRRYVDDMIFTDNSFIKKNDYNANWNPQISQYSKYRPMVAGVPPDGGCFDCEIIMYVKNAYVFAAALTENQLTTIYAHDHA